MDVERERGGEASAAGSGREGHEAAEEERGGEEDRVNGFEAGADDYVAKPFSVRELVLRVRALLRRSDGPPSESGEAKGSAMTRGPIEIDVASHRVLVDGADLSLTALEFRLLHTLMDRAGKVQSREVLLKDVWGMNPELTTRTVDTHVTRLRRKLGAQPGQWIETLRGVGYRFRTEDPSGRG